MMRRPVNIGLYDMDFFDLNFGVNALGICNVIMFNQASEKTGVPVEFTVFTEKTDRDVAALFEPILKKKITTRSVYPISIRRPWIFRRFCQEAARCDVFIDATGGDSFADIYGNQRFIKGTIAKIVMSKNDKLILAPQTIGPFKHRINERFAVKAMNRAYCSFTRDNASYEYVRKIAPNAKVQLSSDVAFGLPYDTSAYNIKESGKIEFGINISGLLWKGGYDGNNQFGLTLEYQDFMRVILEKYSRDSKYRVHLIAHVIEDGAYEDDYSVCKELAEQYPNAILAPKFTSPIDAKNYICHLDLFMGARMHATIGAFSSGVPTIPIAYSRKFEGLFGSLGYSVNIDCKRLSTEQAISQTIELVENYKEIGDKMSAPLAKSRERINRYREALEETLIRISNQMKQ